MVNRAYAFSLKLVVLIALVAIASFANVQESSARKKNVYAGMKCECACVGDSDDHLEYRQYNAAANCTSYNNKTCNYEGSTGGARTGHLVGCKGRIPEDESLNDSSGGYEQTPTPPKKRKKTDRATTSGSHSTN